ncbi:MAG: phosphoglycerate mutase family protein, partial [Sphingomonas sp.]
GPESAPIYVMRHLDTPEGERDPDLTERGQKGAWALTEWFQGKPLSVIYISDFRRTRQTISALNGELQIRLRLYDPSDTPALVARVKAETGPVLIVGHSNTVPDIVEQLGGERPAALIHPDFGDVWTIDGRTTRRDRLTY